MVVARDVTALLALLAGLSLQYIGGTMLSIWFKTSGFCTICALQAVLASCSATACDHLALLSLLFPVWTGAWLLLHS